MIDVERVAGNFHISMHGLSLFVASMVLFKNFTKCFIRIILDEMLLKD